MQKQHQQHQDTMLARDNLHNVATEMLEEQVHDLEGKLERRQRKLQRAKTKFAEMEYQHYKVTREMEAQLQHKETAAAAPPPEKKKKSGKQIAHSAEVEDPEWFSGDDAGVCVHGASSTNDSADDDGYRTSTDSEECREFLRDVYGDSASD